jgi:hypothetical protein
MRNPIVFCALVATMAAATATAQTKPRAAAENDPDIAEIAQYRLTTATLQKVTVATHAMAQALAADPKYKDLMAAQKELNALHAKEEPTEAEQKRIEELETKVETMQQSLDADKNGGKNEDAKTIDDMVRMMGKIPHMNDSLQAAGLAPREYAKFVLVTMQASFAAAFKKSGQLKELPPGMLAENVQFVVDHEAEIKKMNDEMQMLNGGKR